MKILFVLGFPNPFAGAAWTRIGFLSETWSKQGFAVDVLGTFTPNTLNQRGSKLFRNRTSIFNIIPSIYLDNYPLGFVINSFTSFLASTFFLVAKRPNVAIVSVPTGDAGLGSIMACKIARIKYIIDYRDEWEDYASSKFNGGNPKWFYQLLKKSMAHLYIKSCLTITVTSTFLSNLKCRGVTNIALMPNGADTSVFRPFNKSETRKKLNLAESDFVIVYSGIIGEYYKLDIIIKTMANIRGSTGSFKLLLVGEGPDLPALQKLSTSLGLNDSVLYLGVKNNLYDVAEIISASDVGIIPGIYSKGQVAVKFFEYCACGVPVIAIAPNDSDIAHIISEYKVGLTIPSIGENELAKAIHKLYTDIPFRVDAEKRARVLIEEKFDRKKTAQQYLELINELNIKC